MQTPKTLIIAECSPVFTHRRPAYGVISSRHRFQSWFLRVTVSSVYPTKPAVLVENSLYWILDGDLVGILEFDLERKSIAMIQPPVDVLTKSKYQNTVVRTEGGGLGFLFVSRSQYNAQLWKRKTNLDGVASWVLERTIELERLLSLNSVARVNLCVREFAEDNNVLFLGTPIGVFMIHIESLQFKKLPDHTLVSCNHSFESVYAAGT